MQDQKGEKGVDYCFGCFHIRNEKENACSFCGYEQDAQANSPVCLVPGTIIHDQYIIGRVIGQGGFGITYLGFNLAENKKVAIKEYFPDGIVTRVHGETKVSIYSVGMKESFELGVKKFFKESQMLAKFKNNPNIINVYNYFLENNTAYYVMEYIDGITLKQYLSQNGGKITTTELFKIIFPIIDALDEVHQNNVLHRDISPENIYITKNGVAKLLDFGAARQVFGDNNKSLSIVLKPGFAPEEQYRKKGIQGPWTDIYSLGATMYFALSGQNIPDALDRLRDDSETRTLSEIVPGINSEIAKVIMKALAPIAEDRYSSIKDFRNALISAAISDNSINYKMKAVKSSSVFKRPAHKIGVVAAGLIIVAGITLYILSLPNTGNIFGLYKGASLEDVEFVISSEESNDSQISGISNESSLNSSIFEGESSFNQAYSTSENFLVSSNDTSTESLLDTPTSIPTQIPTSIPTIQPTITPTPIPKTMIYFGKYEQDANLNNGPEDIEWIVLDKKDDKYLLISKYGLDGSIQYDIVVDNYIDVTWEDCSMRKWLNETFFDVAFNMEEKEKILSVTLSNPDNPTYGTEGGNDTTDKVFLLSIDEAYKYLPTYDERKAKSTKYAISHDGYRDDLGYTVWWLRSPGELTYYVAQIASDGQVYESGVPCQNGLETVRPAIWIDIENINVSIVTSESNYAGNIFPTPSAFPSSQTP